MISTSAARKRDQRARDKTMAIETESDQWPERVCLSVLADPRWKGGPLCKAAWKRLGEIYEWL